MVKEMGDRLLFDILGEHSGTTTKIMAAGDMKSETEEHTEGGRVRTIRGHEQDMEAEVQSTPCPRDSWLCHLSGGLRPYLLGVGGWRTDTFLQTQKVGGPDAPL